MIIQFLANGLVNGALIALVALGFSLVYNTTRIFHIAYAGIYLWAAYILYFFLEILHWPLAASFLMAILGSGLISLACEKLIYAPLSKRGRSPNSLMISSVGVLILMVSLGELAFGNAARYADIELPGSGLDIGLLLPGFKVISLLLVTVVIVLFFLFLKYSSMGIRIRALRDEELLSRVFGVNTALLKAGLFVLSGFLVAIASGLNMLDMGINPHLGIPIFINAFVALVIGGIGRFDGPVLGGILLGLLQAMTEYFFDSRWVMMVTFILLFIFLIIRPQGLIPSRTRAF